MNRAIQEEAVQRGITRLCHFTPSRNLAHILRDPNRMMNFGTSFDVEMGVARKDRTHGQTLTTR